MTLHKTEKYLKARGFRFERDVNHGAFWNDGISRVLVGRDHAGRNWHNFVAQVKRAENIRREVVNKERKEMDAVLIKKANGDARKVLHLATPEPVKEAPKSQAPDKTEKAPRKMIDTETRQLMKLRVEELLDEGITVFTEIQRELAKDKFTMPDGKPLTYFVVRTLVMNTQNEIAARKLRARLAPATPPPMAQAAPATKPASTPITQAAPDEGLPLWCVQILRRSDWSAEKKIRVILAYVED